MCGTLKYYVIGYCLECDDASASFEREVPVCKRSDIQVPDVFTKRDPSGYYGADCYRELQSGCVGTLSEKPLAYKFQGRHPLVDQPILQEFCIRCVSECAWKDFIATRVTGNSDTHPVLADYLSSTRFTVHRHQWWKRTPHWSVIKNLVALIPGEESHEARRIPASPFFGTNVLRMMDLTRLGWTDKTLRWHADNYKLPPWFWSDERSARGTGNSRYGRGLPVPEAIQYPYRSGWIYLPSTITPQMPKPGPHFDFQCWFPHQRRVTNWPRTDLDVRFPELTQMLNLQVPWVYSEAENAPPAEEPTVEAGNAARATEPTEDR